MRYVYSLIRFVPDPARGEFVNVGAIVGSEISSEWQVRQIENPTRARAIDDRSLLEAVWSFIDRVGIQIDKYEDGLNSLFGVTVELDEAWLERLHSEHENVVQLTPPVPVSASTADEAMERVFELMILDPASRRFGFQKKHAALAAVRSAYARRNIKKGRDLRERVQLKTTHHAERIDFAITNGKVLQLAQTFSFQVPDQASLAEQIKAWGWTIRDARDQGGTVTVPGDRQYDVDREVDIEVVYVPPLTHRAAPAFNDARSVFEAVHAEARPLSQADLVADRAEQLLVQAGVGRLPPPTDSPGRRTPPGLPPAG
jgi:hypothetical protein